MKMNQILPTPDRPVRPSHPSTPDPYVSDQTRRDVAVPAAPPHFTAPLEDLPPEIRLHVLSMLDLDGLNALVHASPVYHEQYLLYRRFLLEQCLQTTLGGVYVDACAAYRTASPDFFKTRTRDAVEHFLESYHEQRSSAECSIYDEKLAGNEPLEMAVFHATIVRPLTRCYTSRALANVASENRKPQDETPVSKTEERRLMRAMYRFQLCCNLFGVGSHEYTSQQPSLDLGCVDILSLFFSQLAPWEVEEIGCIYTFAQEKYNQIFNNIHWDVHHENPKFEGQYPSMPPGAFDLDNSCE